MADISVAPVTFVPGTTVSQDRVPSKALTQNDFLKLLVAQMVSFTQLEQSKNMQSDIASLRSQQEILQANSLLGRTVEIQDESKARVTGPVTAVQMEAGTPKLVVNGKRYDLGDLLSITPQATN